MVTTVVQLLERNEGLWTDQCCINQGDPTEKAAAISSMDIVYQSAARVFIVIQDIELTVDEWDLFLAASDPSAGPHAYSNTETIQLSRIFTRLMSTRCLDRAWCLHEVQLGQNQMFLIPVGDEIKHFGIKHIHKLFTMTIDQISHHPDLVGVYEKVFLTYSNINEASLYSLPTDHLMARFGNVIELNCSVTSDKISICLNVANIPLAFGGRAISTDHCRWILGTIALAAGDTTVLCGVGPSVTLDYFAERSSWMRWSRFLVMDRNFRPNSDLMSVASMDTQFLDLTVLDMTEMVLRKPSWNFVNPSKIALQGLVRNLELRGAKDLLYRMQLHSDNPRQLEQLQLLANIIASALHCGPAWMRFQHEKYTQQPDFHFNQVLHAQSFEICLKYLLIETRLATSHEVDRHDLSSLVGLLFVLCARSRVFFESLGAINGAPLLDHCHILSIGGQHALATISPESVGKHRIVVPKVLTGSDTCVPRRLWVLQQLDDDAKNFEILYKTKLFTFDALCSDVRVGERQIRIVGPRKAPIFGT